MIPIKLIIYPCAAWCLLSIYPLCTYAHNRSFRHIAYMSERIAVNPKALAIHKASLPQSTLCECLYEPASPDDKVQFASAVTTLSILRHTGAIDLSNIDSIISEFLQIPSNEISKIHAKPIATSSMIKMLKKELERGLKPLQNIPPPPPAASNPATLHPKHIFAQIQSATGIKKYDSVIFEFINQYTFSQNRIRYYPFNHDCFVTSLDFIDGFNPRPFAIPLPEFPAPEYPEEIFWQDHYQSIPLDDLEIKLSVKNQSPVFVDGEIWADYAFIAHSKHAQFEQEDGIHWLRGGLVMGFNNGSFGEYTLSNGLLHANFQIIGLDGAARFFQLNGRNAIERFMFIGLNQQNTSYYYLSDGYIIGNIIVGLHGKGTFHQLSGTVQSRWLAVGCEAGTGKFLLRDGGVYIDWLTVGIGASYVEVDQNINAPWATGTGQFIHEGGELTAALASIGSKGSTGTYRLLKKGIFRSTICHIGHNLGSTGMFEQNGGLNHTDALNIGLSGTGTYKINNGNMELRLLIVGNSPQTMFTPDTPNGLFIQKGGTITFQAEHTGLAAYIGVDSGFGVYELHGGSITTTILHIGYDATGSFHQLSGTHTARYIELGTAFGTGSYTMETGLLRAHSIAVGTTGNASFVQHSGSVFTSNITIGTMDNAYGSYSISGGNLITGNLIVGGQSGNASFSIGSPRTHIIIADEHAVSSQRNSLIFGGNARFDAVPDSVVILRNATVQITGSNPENLAGLSNLTLIADNGYSFIEAAGKDHGASPNGFTDNFALHELHIYGSDTVSVEIGNDTVNQPRWEPGEALYVDTLSLSKDTRLIITGTTVYYRNLQNNGGTISGSIIPIDNNSKQQKEQP